MQGGSISVGLEAETNNWLPGTGAFASPGVNVAYAIYDPLTKRDDTGVVRPYLAEALTPNEDLTEWTIQLREGVEFHDGTPFDAAALKTIFDKYLKAEGSNLAGVLANVDSIEVTGPLTAVYRLKLGNAALPDILAGASGWPFSPTAAEKFGQDAGANPVGTGPFVFDSWQRDSRLVVKRNANYWQEGLPYLDQITFRPIPDEDTRLASLLSGDVDAMQSLRQSIVRQARDADGIRLFEFLGNNGGGAIFNTKTPPVDDARIRKSLAHAINQTELVAVLGGAGISPNQTQWFSPDSPYYSEDVAEQWPSNDVATARQLLDDYVNDPDRSDGKAVGAKVAIEFNCPPDPSLTELSQVYQASWTAAGYEVKLNTVEQATHIQNALQDNYMINCWRMGGEDDPYITLSNAFGPPDRQPLNFTNFTDPVVDANLEILRTETDLAKRKEAVEAIMILFTEQVPNLWTGATASVVATSESVRNVDGWKFPDGTSGDGTPSAQVMWGQVWLAT